MSGIVAITQIFVITIIINLKQIQKVFIIKMQKLSELALKCYFGQHQLEVPIASSQLGFTDLNMSNSNFFEIVDSKQDALEVFSEIIQVICFQIKNKEVAQSLLKEKENFIGTKTDFWEKKIIGEINTNTKTISFARLFYYKKPPRTLFFYQINKIQYSLAPIIVKLVKQFKESEQSTFLCFGSSSSTYIRTEYFVEKKRGLEDKDIEMLLRLHEPSRNFFQSKVRSIQ